MTGALASGRNRALRALSGPRTTASPRLVEAALAVLLGILAALIALRLFAPLPLPQGNAASASGRPAAAASPLAVKNPFPAADAPVAAAEEAAPEVADTTLDLHLTGVWANDAQPSATIKTPNGKEKRFVVGEDIVGGARLESVYSDQVIINRGGVRESLRFESKPLGASSPSQSRGPRRGTGSLHNTPTSITNAVGGNLGEFIRLAPGTDETGKLVIDIYAARNRKAFNAVGLKDGDRLVSINGSPPPTNPAALTAVMSAVQRDAQVTLIVRRDGREIPVTLKPDALGKQ